MDRVSWTALMRRGRPVRVRVQIDPHHLGAIEGTLMLATEIGIVITHDDRYLVYPWTAIVEVELLSGPSAPPPLIEERTPS